MTVINSTTEEQLTNADFERISQSIYHHCGINLHDGKRNLVRARLAKRMRIMRFKNFSEYLDYALAEPPGEEFTSLVDAISTNLTCFFREVSHYNYLSEQYLPALQERKMNARSMKMRFWSAGCSSGEEPYSMAICLLDNLPSSIDLKILASDVSTDMIHKAELGIYDGQRLEPLTLQQKQKYMTLINQNKPKQYQAKSILKNLIRFRYVNLIQPWPFNGCFDVIFCRNVMIYFDKTTQEQLINRFWERLELGGLLCIGHSESLAGIKHKFRYVQPATYMKY